jgi:hypothetical protein
MPASFQAVQARTDCLIGEKMWGRWQMDRE